MARAQPSAFRRLLGLPLEVGRATWHRRASRLVSQAIRAGYVRRGASQADGRRIRLELTEAGNEMAKAAHRFRQEFFDYVVRDWSVKDREDFARC